MTPSIFVPKEKLSKEDVSKENRDPDKVRPVQSRVNVLKKKLTNMITLSKEFKQSKASMVNFDDFLNQCEDLQFKMESFFELEKQSKSHDIHNMQGFLDDDLKTRLEFLKSQLRALVDVYKDFQKNGVISPIADKFIEVCDNIQNKLMIIVENTGSVKLTVDDKENLKDLKHYINEMEEATDIYKKHDILAAGAEKFLSSCSHIKSEIESKIDHKPDNNSHMFAKLKEHINDVEGLIEDIKHDDITCCSMEKFSKDSDIFIAEIEHYEENKTPISGREITDLIEHLSHTIKLSKEAKRSGLVSGSVDALIQSCEQVKNRFERKQNKPENHQQPLLSELRRKLGDLLHSATKLKAERLISVSIDNFIKSCETTKTKMDLDTTYKINDKLAGLPADSCKYDLNIFPDSSDRYRNIINEKSLSKQSIASTSYEIHENKPLEPSTLCEIREKNPMDRSPLQLVSEFQPKPSSKSSSKSGTTKKRPVIITSPENSSIEKDMCDISKHSKSYDSCLENFRSKRKEKMSLFNPNIFSDLGLLEDNVRKIIKTTRTLNKNGTISEKREITTIRIERHNTMDTKHKDSIFMKGNDDSRVEYVIVADQNRKGLDIPAKKARSEIIFRVSSKIIPLLRQSISTASNLVEHDNYFLYDLSNK